MSKPAKAAGGAHHTSSHSEQGGQQEPTDLLCHEERKAYSHFTTFLELRSVTFLKQSWPKFSPQSSSQWSRSLQGGLVCGLCHTAQAPI